MRHSIRIKDEEGYPAFALVNKVTGEAIKHSLGQSHPVHISAICICICIALFSVRPPNIYLFSIVRHQSV
jgi:hypothetical protein